MSLRALIRQKEEGESVPSEILMCWMIPALAKPLRNLNSGFFPDK